MGEICLVIVTSGRINQNKWGKVEQMMVIAATKEDKRQVVPGKYPEEVAAVPLLFTYGSFELLKWMKGGI